MAAPGVARRDTWDPASQRNAMGPEGVETMPCLSRVEELGLRQGFGLVADAVPRTMP